MHWKLKCAAFYALRWMPHGVHAFMQQRVTGRYFQRLDDATLSTYQFHVNNFPGGVAVEFGAGRNLLTPLLLSHAGAERVYALDLERLATVELVNAMISELRNRMPGSWPQISSFEDLTRLYRIEYRAPGDARNTKLKDVGMVYSTSTLEHIPTADIRAILAESKKILSPGGKMSFIIDYHDHYGTADNSITRWNFYRYSARQWRKWNPSNHFQNRLRHSDYERMFEEAGLESIEARRVVQPWAAAELDRTRVCADFHYSRDDLMTTNGYFVLVHPNFTKNPSTLHFPRAPATAPVL